MKSRSPLVILLVTMLLVDSLALKWQAMGSGMNNTVISEIWDGITPKLQSALASQGGSGLLTFVKDISDRLNARWDPAWNVVMIKGKAEYDAVLYGYAFRNQWMWYNGVPQSYTFSSTIISLIVWKDYNCQDWKNPKDYSSSTFTTAQKATIKAEAIKITQGQLSTDIWGAAFSMMNNIQANSDFTSGGFSVIMTQDSAADINGYVCRVGYNHYNYNIENGQAIAAGLGNFYLFQTR